MKITPLVLCVIALVCTAACGDATHETRALPGDAGSRVAGRSASASEEGPAIPADAPLVIFLGDSIAAGLHLPAGQAFPAVLQRRLAREGSPFRLVNAGVSGDTSAGGLERIDWILKQKPDVLVVELGGNDGLRGQDVQRIESNLTQIVARAHGAGARVLLLGVRIPTSYGATYSNAFAALYERVAEAQDVALVPHFMNGVGGVPEMTLEDGLHPARQGHEKLAENIAPTLRTVLDAWHANFGGDHEPK